MDLNRVIEGLNELEMSISKHGVKTISRLSKVIVDIAEGNEDFRISANRPIKNTGLLRRGNLFVVF